LIRRRAAGETFRAVDYGVAHTTLVRYFGRPEVARQLKEGVSQLRVEQRALADRRSAARRLEQQLRREAREQAARERDSARRPPASRSGIRVRRSGARDPYEAWLDEHERPAVLTGADRYSQNDRTAAAAVAAGGGLQAVIDATGLQTVDNVVRLIDPAILKQALDNDLSGTRNLRRCSHQARRRTRRVA